MQQFNVPQFIDVEDKVIGPITARQFVIILFCAVLAGISYKLFDFVIFIFAAVIIFILGGVIAFMKINGRPFHFFILNVMQTITKPKIRIWNNKLSKTKEELTGSIVKEIAQTALPQRKPVYARSKLAELSLVVDTGGIYQGGDTDIQTVRSTKKQPSETGIE